MCCSKDLSDNKNCRNNSGLGNSAFLIIVLYILLALILGGILYY